MQAPGQISGCPPIVQPSRSVGQSRQVVFRQKARASVAASVVPNTSTAKVKRCTPSTYHPLRRSEAWRAALFAFLCLSLERPATAEPDDHRATNADAPRGAARKSEKAGRLEGADEQPDARPPAYFFRVGFETTARDFTDTDSAPGAARTYHAFPVPGFVLSAEVYPLLHGLLGLDGSFAQSVGATSTTSDRASVGTTYLRAEGALKARIPFSSKASAPWLALFAGYGYTGYTFGAVPPDREIPSARYNALRLGADARVRVNRFHFTGAAEYDHLLTIGDQGTALPASPVVSTVPIAVRAQTPGYGLTARLGAGFELVRWLLVRVDGRLTWVTYDYVRTPSAKATDQYVTASLSLEALF